VDDTAQTESADEELKMSDASPAGTADARADRRVALAKKMPELLYGAVVAASILAVSSLHGPTNERVAMATVGVSVTYWLAHIYVDAVGGRFQDAEHSTFSRLARAFRENTEILVGAFLPIVVFVVGQIFGLDVSGAAWLALWFTVALLMAAGGYAAALAGVRGTKLVVETLVAGSVGLMVIALKYALH
jgi:hypothetical protein